VKDISIIIAVYKKSYLLGQLIKRLVNQLSEKGEIIIIADEPNQETLRILKKYDSDIKYFINKKRKGKVHALNFAAKKAKGNILLFLDADVKIEDDKFVETVVKEIEDASILKVKIKAITNSLLSRLVSIDYYNMYLSQKLASKFNTQFGLNGICLAIKRDVFFKLKGFKKTITEDIDFGLRASIADINVKHSNNLELYTQSPSTWKGWYIQRKRWAIGGSICILDHLKYILLKPKIWIPILIMAYPSIIYLLISMILPDYFIYKLISLVFSLLVFALPVGIISPILFTLSFGIVIAKAAFLAFITFVIWSAIILFSFKKLQWGNIKLYDLPIYYFVYSMMWLLISYLCFIKVCMARIRKKEIKLEDWIT
jgi:cellulose synthase/poly-beta-1,6-N-acetylglucosamine synthase-like glycosyltransferase